MTLDLPHQDDLIKEEYEVYLRKKDSPDHLPKLTSDAIEVDVARSFNHQQQVSGHNLNNILKAYATVNREALDYCQGMNFIAGFLYLVLSEGQSEGREDLAFAVMREVISRFRMHELFNPHLPMLKLNFYQLDRLIAILLPDLHTHFKVR